MSSADWTENSEGLATSDLDGHLVFWGVSSRGRPSGAEGVGASPKKGPNARRHLWEIKEVGGLRDAVWASWHCCLGWGVQNACGTVGALSGGRAACLAVARGGGELVACEAGGSAEVRLVRYPALPGAKARGFTGHAQPPEAIR